MNAYIFHGTEGNPQENWFPWLAAELEKRGVETTVPQLSNPDYPDLNTWLADVSSFKTGPDTILIGHSLGAVLILRMLERGHHAKRVYLCAPFLHDLGWKVLEESFFFSDDFDWDTIKKHCPRFEILASANDPHVPLEDVDKVARGLGVEMQTIDIEKHFNAKEFPYLLERVVKNLDMI
ncbi:MAG: alpha/beta fold hydrolase [Patescibacteria group bacterium]